MKHEKLNVLLIEDDHDDAEMTIYTLDKVAGMDITHVDDGHEAIQYLLGNDQVRPDIVLLDLRMPRVDGVEVLRAIKKDTRTSAIPVIAFISSPSGKTYLESFKLQADAYLEKPISVQTFLEAVTQIGLSEFSVNKAVRAVSGTV